MTMLRRLRNALLGPDLDSAVSEAVARCTTEHLENYRHAYEIGLPITRLHYCAVMALLGDRPGHRKDRYLRYAHDIDRLRGRRAIDDHDLERALELCPLAVIEAAFEGWGPFKGRRVEAEALYRKVVAELENPEAAMAVTLV